MKTRLSQILKCVPVAAAAVLTPSSGLAVDYFLKIDGIEGESMDAKHKGELEVQSFSFGVSNSAAPIGGGGGGSGRADFSDLSMTAYLSKASPQLYLHCAVGKHVKEVRLVARKPGKDTAEFYTVTLTDVLVSSVHTSGSAGGSAVGSDMPMDSVTFNYSKIEWSYRPQKPDGSLDAPVKANYDLKTNKGG